MRIHLMAVGTRMPDWVVAGFEAYARRLPPECALVLKEIPPVKRRRSMPLSRVIETEGERLLARLPTDSHVLALDERGKAWSTPELAGQFNDWLQLGRDLSLMIGGADGLSAACIECADQCWSLSRLTLPHGLARVIVAEQLYRAWSILNNHPYHRA